MKIAITGHRPSKLGGDYDLTSKLLQDIKIQILWELHLLAPDYVLNKHFFTLITGMALGIDTLFAKIAIEGEIPFIAAIPCKQQYKKWAQKSRELWMDITDHKLCDKYYVSEEVYTHDCMQKRNEWMVDNCDILIAVWDGTSGGTANCVEYAKSKGKQIIFISPNDLK